MFRQPFVEGWDFIAILGEGAFGQVKLAMNTENNNQLIAVKIISTKNVEDLKNIQKEICIHKCLSHERIVKFHGYRCEPDECYIFLEYVSGGELYNLIEPGAPLEKGHCIRLFSQLLDGVEYLHNKGIVHRDLKLENLLLDDDENLKITDFGLSTLFKHQGKERLLERVCGSLPYTAPEVLSGMKHRAEPTDIWSCGIILYILFQGEKPWEIADLTSFEYSRWVKETYPNNKWAKLNKYQMDILRKILNINPSERITIPDIRLSRWFKSFLKQDIKSFGILSQNVAFSAAKSTMRYSASQPPINNTLIKSIETASVAPNAHATDDAFFSQPIQTEDILATQAPLTPGFDGLSQLSFVNRLSKRLTRFIVANIDFSLLMMHMEVALNHVNCSWKSITPKCISIMMNDISNSSLNFKVHFFCASNGKILVDFRLYKGDGLEFRRIYKLIKIRMVELIPSIL